MVDSTSKHQRLDVLVRQVQAAQKHVDIEDLVEKHWPSKQVTEQAIGTCSSCGRPASQACSGKDTATKKLQPKAASVIEVDIAPPLNGPLRRIDPSAVKKPRINTADQYLKSLRGRSIKCYLNGELMQNIFDHPMVVPSINAMTETFRIAEERPELATTVSSLTGLQVSRFLHVAESAEDLVMQGHMQRELGRRTGCCFQRCVGMDALNATWSTTFDVDAKFGTSYHQRFKDFLTMMQENGYVMAGSMTDPKGDRYKSPAQQHDPDLFVRVVDRKPNGSVVLRGAKMHQTGVLNSHYMLIMPGGRLDEKEKDYAICCAVPVDHPNVTYIYGRQSCDLRAVEDSDIDNGNAKYGGQETVTCLQDVEVPPEYIFMNGEIDFTGTLVERFTAYHRRSYICKAGLADVMLGAAATVSDYNGTTKASHIKDKLVEMSYLAENIAGTSLAASFMGKPTKSGCYLPDMMFANICKHNVTRYPYEIARLTTDLAGGLMVTLPSDKDFKHDVVGPLLEKYLSTKQGVTSENRRRILRLIENMTLGRNAIGFLSESMHGAGSPQAQRILIQRLMDVEEKKKLAKRLAGIQDK